jgi:hypothetical protein
MREEPVGIDMNSLGDVLENIDVGLGSGQRHSLPPSELTRTIGANEEGQPQRYGATPADTFTRGTRDRAARSTPV